jgi:TadE-like protein
MKIDKHHIERKWRAFIRGESGTTMVEFAICISLFLLILFAVLDFGRLGYNWVVAEKAMQRGVRIATVRPPVCAGVPIYHARDSGLGTNYSAGTLCSTDGGICEQVNVQCLLSNPDGSSQESQDTADEIWAALENLLPQGATSSNVLLRYQYDRRLGFIGGPYVPVITAQLVGSANGNGYNELPFTFITPLSALAANVGAANANTIPGSIPFPAISVTIPAEDMNQGVKG